MATTQQRQAGLAQQGFEEVRVNGRRRLRRFTSAVGQKPARHAKIKTVGECWQEHMHGIGGNRAAREFESHEKGSTYSRRKPLCDTLRDLVSAGKAPATAIRLVNDCYPSRDWSFGKMCRDLGDRRREGTLQASLRI